MIEREFTNAIIDTALGEAFLEWERRRSENIPPKAELDKLYTPSERQAIRMKRLFAQDNRRTIIRMTLNVARKIAAAVVVSAAVLFALFLATAEGRAAVANAVLTWYDEFVSIVSPAEQDEGVDLSAWRVEYVPEGFVLVEDTSMIGLRSIFYSSEDEYFHVAITADGAKAGIGFESGEYEEIISNAVIYYCFWGDDGENIVYWSTEGSSFTLGCNLSKEEALLVAQGIKK
ncbi:hypothetical protein FACS1894217_03900 [Clostridia bacterium]|nr:hypothetical protein FACS1894217_03900 [Clostridia bacterium]